MLEKGKGGSGDQPDSQAHNMAAGGGQQSCARNARIRNVGDDRSQQTVATQCMLLDVVRRVLMCATRVQSLSRHSSSASSSRSRFAARLGSVKGWRGGQSPARD
jgi:hypothetical protein